MTERPDGPQTTVEYRSLGQSGLRVSVPILGGMVFGSNKWIPWVMNEDQALPLLKSAWDRGVNTWDTANVYSQGESERIIAKAIKTYNIPRPKLVILTKCHRLVADDLSIKPTSAALLKDTRDYVNQSGLSRMAIFNAVDASLRRLETDYIDLLQIHRYDPDVSAEETMKALDDLVKQGKVRYIGACTMWTWQLAHYNQVAERHGFTKLVSMQSNYSLLTREDERELNSYCNFAGIGLIPWGTLSFGLLSRPLGVATYRSETSGGTFTQFNTTAADEEIIRRVEKLAKDKEWTMSQVALAWIHPKVTSPIVGITSARRLEEAIISNKKLTAEEMKYLEQPYEPRALTRYT